MNYSSLVTDNSQSSFHPHPVTSRAVPSLQHHQLPSSMTSTRSSNPYANQQPGQPYYSTSPQTPPSPPVEDSQKCSLPSISSLLETMPAAPPGQESDRQVPASQRSNDGDGASLSRGLSNQSNMSNRVILPPTPPLRPGSGFDAPNQSPSAASSHSSTSTQAYFNTSDNQLQRQRSYGSAPQKRQALPIQTSQPAYTNSPYASSPGTTNSTSPYYSPVDMTPSSAMYYQRPLPTTYPQAAFPVAITPAAAGMDPLENRHEHHHHFPLSTHAQYPQSPERYICPNCKKGFSRPSSLRIHSYSHTGEKPYRCTQPGCPKTFSVRSNMKRHEKGCHSGAARSGSEHSV